MPKNSNYCTIALISYASKVIGEGNGTPLQYSCLENPMDGGAWWATVHGVAKSQTRLSHFTFTFNLTDEDSPSWFKHSLKAQPPNTITFEGQDFNIWIWGGHTHSDYSKNQPQLGTSCIRNILTSTLKVKVLVTQSCPGLCKSMDCGPPGSSVHGILQARILE